MNQMNSPQKYPDDVDFFYSLENHGWSTCIIFVGGKMYEMGPTHIFENPIAVLLNSLIDLLAGATESDFTWHDEPGEYKWSIKRNQEQSHKIDISIADCVQISGVEKQKLVTLNFEVKLKLFSICVLRQMEKICDLMSEKSFKEHREGEFPFNTFSEFRRSYERAYS
jgi:hypothetical protein